MPDSVTVTLEREEAEAALKCVELVHSPRWSSTGCPDCEAMDKLRAALNASPQASGWYIATDKRSITCAGCGTVRPYGENPCGYCGAELPVPDRPDCQSSDEEAGGNVADFLRAIDRAHEHLDADTLYDLLVDRLYSAISSASEEEKG